MAGAAELMHPLVKAYVQLLFYGWNPEDPESMLISVCARQMLDDLGVDKAALRERMHKQFAGDR